jgi:hypothetical protein
MLPSRAVLVLALSLCLKGVPLHAQSWSAAEQAIIDRLNECARLNVTRDLEGRTTCSHRDFSGWPFNLAAPRDYDHVIATTTRNYGVAAPVRLEAMYVQPLAIRIKGNIATVHSYYNSYRRHPDGTVEVSRERWLDVMINDGGRWSFLADFGGPDDVPGPIPR